MSSKRIEKLFSDPKFMADYSRWLEDPITKEMFLAAEELSEPVSLSRPDPNAALYMHGVYVGFNRMKSFLRGANKVLEAAEDSSVEETYGEARVLESMYPQITKARSRATKKAPTA